ncbi:hypothetical protein [Photobacterium damselae]|uniref:Uncharacterized protein n=1 Tax=Photobacterium damselae subsp. damselae TaxID=85581 RepID=A0A5N4FLF8_PHODD|nr:hypothetical protein [Photobacterium damselae]KAB1505026.1 hypothetical protein FD717_018980 [Photobacterium damselae subsp. damselae]NVP02570.1 hypothetical protein [Photobacterium damselae subsp. damselae]
MKKRQQILFVGIFMSMIPLNAYSETKDYPLTFLIKAHISSDILGYRITDFKITPDRIETTYDPEKEMFDESVSEMKIVSNIPTERKEIFEYTLMLSRNEASCLLLNGETIDYDTPQIFIGNDKGISTEITKESPIENIKLLKSYSNYKSDNKNINIKFKKIKKDSFFGHIHHCSGGITLMAGLSL